jgi:hypothetical protein
MLADFKRRPNRLKAALKSLSENGPPDFDSERDIATPQTIRGLLDGYEVAHTDSYS